MMKLFGIESKSEKAAKVAAEQRQREEAEKARAAGINPEALTTLSGHTNCVTSLAVLSNERLASGSLDNLIKIWNVTTGKCEITLSGHTNYVSSIRMLSNGQLVSGSWDQTIKLWDISTGKCEATISEHLSKVNVLTVLPDGRLAIGGFDGSIKLFNVSTQNYEETLTGHTSGVYSLIVLPDGRLASGSGDHSIKIWNVVTGQCEATLRGHTDFINALTVLPDGRLVSGALDRLIKFWNVTTEQCEATLSEHTGLITSLIVLFDGRFASIDNDNSIKIWNVSTRRCETTLSTQTGNVNALLVLPDGYLVSGAKDGSIKLWDIGFRPVLSPTAADRLKEPQLQQERKATNKLKEALQKSEENNAALEKVAREASEQHVLVKEVTPVLPPTPPTSSKSSTASTEVPPSTTTAEIIALNELTLGKELGRGGFGVVCEALWQGVTQVAVKQLFGQLTPELIDEFHRETAVHARLRHPNIIALYGICREAAQYAMVMEFMANGSLYDVLKNPAELPWSLRLSLSLDIVTGLLYLHGRNIIHRDLKSLNILIDKHMQAKISDFGLAKIKHTSATMTKGGMGSLYWMAPELFEDDGVCNQATDVYATGMVLWEIASRKLPYENKNQAQILRNVDKGIRETIPSDAPLQFAALITRCWAQRAEDRPIISEVAREMRAASVSGNTQGKDPSASSLDSGYMAFSRKK